MGKKQITPFSSWLSKTPNGIETGYIRLPKTLLLDAGFLSLSPSAKETYLYMVLEAKGKRNFKLPQSKYLKFTTKPTFRKSRDELIAAGFIEQIRSNGNLRKANEYAFSEKWKR